MGKSHSGVKALHTGAWLVGTLGALALLGAWLSASSGSAVFGLDEVHLFDDAKSLFLLGIFLFLGARACAEHGGGGCGDKCAGPGCGCGCHQSGGTCG